MTQELIERLKPCPFCGKGAAMGGIASVPPRYFVNCTMCQATVGEITGYSRQEDAARAWNTRDQSQFARIAELSLEVARRGMALAPFAEACSNCIDDEPDDDSTWEHPVGMEVTFRNFREARDSLTKDSTSG